MICPVKTCKSEIDDDSKYCDQCGSAILVCPHCGYVGTGKFCPRDGQKMEPNKKKIEPQAESIKVGDINEKNIEKDMTTRVTIDNIQQVGQISLTHSSGVTLHITSGDILGRGNGPHMDFLSRFNYISRRHIMVTKVDQQWYIRDLGSTNKTKINGTIIDAHKDMPIKNGDIITLADQEFIVNAN